jgi:hypothetical protein
VGYHRLLSSKSIKGSTTRFRLGRPSSPTWQRAIRSICNRSSRPGQRPGDGHQSGSERQMRTRTDNFASLMSVGTRGRRVHVARSLRRCDAGVIYWRAGLPCRAMADVFQKRHIDARISESHRRSGMVEQQGKKERRKARKLGTASIKSHGSSCERGWIDSTSFGWIHRDAVGCSKLGRCIHGKGTTRSLRALCRVCPNSLRVNQAGRAEVGQGEIV